MFIWAPILGDVELPGSDLSLGPARPTGAHIPAAFVGLAVFALALIVFLVWDFCRQKRVEKRERDRLQRFRQKKLAASVPPGSQQSGRAQR
jgi:hypothetical protein